MALAPMKSRPYFGRAGVLLRHEDYQEAISDYMQAITLNPQNPLSYLYRGYAYKKIGEYEKALADYKKVIDIDSDAFYYVLGTQVPLYRKLGHLEEAEKARQQSEQKVE